MILYDIVTKLTGRIDPVGETNEDGRRLDNLQVTIELTDALIRNILSVSECKNDHRHSMHQAGVKANDYLRTLQAELNNNE